MTEAGNYQWLLETVRAAGDSEAVAALEELGPPPHEPAVREKGIGRRIAMDDVAASERDYMWRALKGTLSSPDMSLRDLDDGTKGAEFSLGALLSGGGDYEVRSIGLDFQIPMFFIQGQADTVTPTPLVRDYAADITSPHTEFIVIPDSGHNVMLTTPEAFLERLLTRVRPALTARGR